MGAWRPGGRILAPEPGEPVCAACGCHEADACVHAQTGACWWADPVLPLCSRCGEVGFRAPPSAEWWLPALYGLVVFGLSLLAAASLGML